MKPSLIVAAICSLGLSLSAFAATPVTGNTGTIAISGSVTAATCDLTVDKTALTFPTVSANTLNSLVADASVGSAQQVKFKFTNCPAGTIDFGLTADKLIPASSNQGAVSFGSKQATEIYYKAFSGNAGSATMDLNGTTVTNANKIVVTGDSLTPKEVPISIQMIRGSGTALGLSGDYAATINYSVSYE